MPIPVNRKLAPDPDGVKDDEARDRLDKKKAEREAKRLERNGHTQLERSEE